MATRVSRGKIWLAAFDGPTPKTSLLTQRSCRCILHKPRFVPKFIAVAMGVSYA